MNYILVVDSLSGEAATQTPLDSHASNPFPTINNPDTSTFGHPTTWRRESCLGMKRGEGLEFQVSASLLSQQRSSGHRARSLLLCLF